MRIHIWHQIISSSYITYLQLFFKFGTPSRKSLGPLLNGCVLKVTSRFVNIWLNCCWHFDILSVYINFETMKCIFLLYMEYLESDMIAFSPEITIQICHLVLIMSWTIIIPIWQGFWNFYSLVISGESMSTLCYLYP